MNEDHLDHAANGTGARREPVSAPAGAAFSGSHLPEAAPGVSIVICTRDRADHLRACLSRLASQTVRPTEVIVVDNASIDPSIRSIAEAAGARYLLEKRPGLDFARNAGAREAAGQIVAYTDDDVLLDPAWVEATINAFRTSDADCITGRVLPFELETEAQRLFEAHWSFQRGGAPIDFGPDQFSWQKPFPAWSIGAGASMAFRRDVFARFGWFDEALGAGAAGCGDDSEFWYRIVASGGRCRYDPSILAHHVHRREMAALSRQIEAYMRGHVAALRIQAQRFPGKGNLRRAYVQLPKWYLRRFLRRVRRGPAGETRFLLEEVRGYLAGLVYPIGPRRERLG